MLVAYFDCFSGISGDMILGGLIDLGLAPEVLIGQLDKLPEAGDYWKLSPIEKFVFRMAMKLGLM